MSTEDYRQPDHRDHPETQTGVTNPAPTPRTDAVSKEIGSLACRWKTGDIDAVQFEKAAQQEFDKLATLERELTEARATLLAREGELDSLSAALAAKDREIARLKEIEAQFTGAIMQCQCPNSVYERARAEKAEAELARLKSENESLRTLWTEARDVVTQGRNANCVVSYGKAQCDAVAAANAWLDKMPATVKRTIDDAGNAEWQLQRVTAERDQLRARLGTAEAALAAAQQDTETICLLLASAWLYGGWRAETQTERELEAALTRLGYWPITEDALLIRIAAIDAAREGTANKAQP